MMDNNTNSATVDTLIDDNIDSDVDASQISRLLQKIKYFFNRKSSKENELENNLNTDKTIVTSFLDKQIYNRHCPYCFSDVSDRLYRDKNFPKNGALDKKIQYKPKLKTYICPSCKEDLPSDFFNSHSSSIALIGGREAGKTSYITVFCELLLYEESILNKLGLFGNIINKEGKDQFQGNRQILINQAEALPLTINVEAPIVVQLRSKHHNNVLYLTLIDSPGEDHEDFNKLVEKYGNLHLADGIIFLLNPMDVGGILKKIESEYPGTMPSRSQRIGIENFNIIQNLHQFYTTTQRIKPTKAIDIPTVFCLSRADLLEEPMNLYLSSDIGSWLVMKEDILEEMHMASEELKDFLVESDSRLLNMIDRCFKNYKIFPVSALGKSPTIQANSQKIVGGIDPKGVLQPFLWILIQTKFVK